MASSDYLVHIEENSHMMVSPHFVSLTDFIIGHHFHWCLDTYSARFVECIQLATEDVAVIR